ncbi:lysylphosphatidylglycerol synthase domain-containing protein [Lysobacter arvi]|uniref:Lysylphosphatidylglycerol synthase domain-containing protein n=1 Tax=Lysobacter arvi TaxID=3038776 RepID=A0ABU1CIT2_9GAMM|nr:lysylphosphatidylglycerol synthase domain-containing protein [Lysobacter arvi]MDR0184862.1 lysylphosphatidylglycerol synthase domain-containing protein [Lysobacter arvi]
MTASRQRWRRIRRIGFYVFLALVAFLLVRYARSVEWAEVGRTLAGYGAGTLATAAGLTVASYLLYSAYDLAARRYARHELSTPKVMGISMLAYAFSLNVGALFGGAGFRYRIYSHAGLGLGTISRIVGFAIGTNWMGYLLLAGALFVSGRVHPPPGWPVTGERLPWLGAAMLAAVVVYLVACRLTRGRVLHVRGHHFRLPSLPLALLQLALAATNWALMAALMFVLMPSGVAYPAVLGALLVSAVAAAIAHVPAGFGVLEAVFIALLGHQVPQPQLLAALLAYRACYYLGPLMLAVAGYAAFEARRRKRPAGGDGAGPT